jgi:hypothetical protein
MDPSLGIPMMSTVDDDKALTFSFPAIAANDCLGGCRAMYGLVRALQNLMHVSG